jgi:hypothetical protein
LPAHVGRLRADDCGDHMDGHLSFACDTDLLHRYGGRRDDCAAKGVDCETREIRG